MGDYFYCQICRTNDPRGRKHIYSQKHKDKLKVVLRKFETKMVPVKNCLSRDVTITDFSPSHTAEKFWCPFCAAEVVKHTRDGPITAHFKNWIDHLFSADHHKHVHQFFWSNKLDMGKRDKYKVSQDKYDVIESCFHLTVQKRTAEKRKDIEEEGNRIRELDEKRSNVYSRPPIPPMCDRVPEIPTSAPSQFRPDVEFGNDRASVQRPQMESSSSSLPPECRIPPPSQSNTTRSQSNTPSQNNTPSRNDPLSQSNIPPQPNVHLQNIPLYRSPLHAADKRLADIPGPSRPSGSPHPSADAAPLKGMRTASVVSSGGLTSIARRQKSDTRGNVHSGGLPPWMQEDEDKCMEDERSAAEIGPTEEDFKNHLERERKRKLNPNRVGANFDHGAPTSSDWLPSFGSVWNHGPRSQSSKQYRKEAGKVKRKR